MSKSKLARLSYQVPEVARLVAERDELLAALKRGHDLCERGHGREWAEEIRALIAKHSKE